MGKGKGCAASGGTVVIAEDPAALLTAALAESHAAHTLATGTDGWSLDIEAPVRDAATAANATRLVRAISDAVHAAVPSAQVTFDSDILGFESRFDQYDLVSIAEACDFLVVMCYDAAKNLSSPEFSKANTQIS